MADDPTSWGAFPVAHDWGAFPASKPPFDPSKPYAASKPAFDPAQPFTPAAGGFDPDEYLKYRSGAVFYGSDR
jgi:hypothetical protein